MNIFTKKFISSGFGYGNAEKPHCAPLFRKTFDLDKIPEKASLLITGLGFYRLFINSKEITKGHLSPSITDPGLIVAFDKYDIKPYLAYTDSHPDATCGFADGVRDYKISVDFPEELLLKVSEKDRGELIRILENDPRPSYKTDCERIYGMKFSHYEIFFRYNGESLVVTDVVQL